jgi:UDP-2,3-diacylglucosamine hydrolase
MARRLTIIAGSGALVPQIIATAEAAGDTVQVLALTPQPPELHANLVQVSLQNPQAIIGQMLGFRPDTIVLAGAVSLSQGAREQLASFGGAAGGGAAGDTQLSQIATTLQAVTGAKLVGVHEIIPDLLTPIGTLAGPALNDDAETAALFALRAAQGIGRLDIGQAVVTSGRHIIAAEDIGGTDALLARVALYRQQGLVRDGRQPLILGKACKPDQPLFVDLPAIGPATIANAVAAGIGIIALEAQKTLLISRRDLIDAAEAQGVTVVGLDPGHG